MNARTWAYKRVPSRWQQLVSEWVRGYEEEEARQSLLAKRKLGPSGPGGAKRRERVGRTREVSA